MVCVVSICVDHGVFVYILAYVIIGIVIDIPACPVVSQGCTLVCCACVIIDIVVNIPACPGVFQGCTLVYGSGVYPTLLYYFSALFFLLVLYQVTG